MQSCGPGVERITEEVKKYFPEANLITLSSDTMKSQNLLVDSINKIKSGEVDIMIGTQMIAKGHDFPNLKLVGIIDSDIGLSGGDLRASLNPDITYSDDPLRMMRAIRFATQLNFEIEEHSLKAIAKNAPRLAIITKERIIVELNKIIDAKKPSIGFLLLEKTNLFLLQNYQLSKFDHPQLKLGPAPAPMYFLRGKYRRRFLIKSDKSVNIQKVLIYGVVVTEIVKRKLNIDIENYINIRTLNEY